MFGIDKNHLLWCCGERNSTVNKDTHVSVNSRDVRGSECETKIRVLSGVRCRISLDCPKKPISVIRGGSRDSISKLFLI